MLHALTALLTHQRPNTLLIWIWAGNAVYGQGIQPYDRPKWLRYQWSSPHIGRGSRTSESETRRL